MNSFINAIITFLKAVRDESVTNCWSDINSITITFSTDRECHQKMHQKIAKCRSIFISFIEHVFVEILRLANHVAALKFQI